MNVMIMDNLMTRINAPEKSIENKKWKQSFSADLITEAYSELSQPSMVELLP